MGEEESKSSENNDETNTSEGSQDAKSGIKDRMRAMGILDREKRSVDSAPARPWKLYIIGALIAAGVGLWYMTSGTSFSETSSQPMAHTSPPGARGPYGWPAPPPHFRAQPGSQPGYYRQPPQGWSGPPPAYYYGRRNAQQNSQPNPGFNNQPDRAGAARPWPPQRGAYGPGPGFAQRPHYYGPPPASGDNSSSTEDAGDNTVNQGRPAPGWMQPPAQPQPPQRPQWAGPQQPNYQYPSSPARPRFGPPQRQWNRTPPGWPREAWRATRPEEAQKLQHQQQESPEAAEPPRRQWPEPPRRYRNPYGGFQPSSYQGSNNKDNPWSQ